MAVEHTIGTNTEAYMDRVLQQYREKVVKTGQRRTPVKIKATLIPRPEGYENPKNWTTDTALHLMYLIQENKTAGTLRQALRKIFSSSIAVGNSEVKLRGTEDQTSPKQYVVQIENHLQADLPSARITLNTFMSTNTSSAKGLGEAGDRGYGWSGGGSSGLGSRGPSGGSGGGSGGGKGRESGGGKGRGSGGFGIGGSGGYGIGGSSDESGGESGGFGIGGSGGFGIGGSGGWGIGGSGSGSGEGSGGFGIGGSGGYGIGGSSDESGGESAGFGIEGSGGWGIGGSGGGSGEGSGGLVLEGLVVMV
ncbi:unnamed protein product [Arctia plantaginis]|uniref:Uncharacterized protein n=1 Tax=Arctia plantaginis TaxID=874455 RepID=A0A8S0ZJS5_ARCPL|nr:unnamed protein product [Arctia plantaginis]